MLTHLKSLISEEDAKTKYKEWLDEKDPQKKRSRSKFYRKAAIRAREEALGGAPAVPEQKYQWVANRFAELDKSEMAKEAVEDLKVALSEEDKEMILEDWGLRSNPRMAVAVPARTLRHVDEQLKSNGRSAGTRADARRQLTSATSQQEYANILEELGLAESQRPKKDIELDRKTIDNIYRVMVRKYNQTSRNPKDIKKNDLWKRCNSALDEMGLEQLYGDLQRQYSFDLPPGLISQGKLGSELNPAWLADVRKEATRDWGYPNGPVDEMIQDLCDQSTTKEASDLRKSWRVACKTKEGRLGLLKKYSDRCTKRTFRSQ